MSRAWSRRRAALFASPGGEAHAAPVRGGDAELVGRDFARPRRRARADRSAWVLALATGVLAALLLAALRVQVLRLRYELGEAVREETALLERERTATVALRELRDPRRLHRLAPELGLARPERVIELTLPKATP